MQAKWTCWPSSITLVQPPAHAFGMPANQVTCTETLRTSCPISLKEFVMPFMSFPTFQMSQNQWHCEKLHHISVSCLNSVCACSFPPSLYSLDLHILKKRWRCIITFAQQHSLESACHSLKCKMRITFFAQQQSLEAACIESRFMLQCIFFPMVFSSTNQ